MRVVGGRFGGRRLQVPPGRGTRPTVEKVREALFNMLGSSVSGAVVVDLYAGSGSLGIEALSRGAQFAAFVDLGHAAISAIRHNLSQLHIEPPLPFDLIQRPVERCASALRSHAPFDLVLIDPPFAAVRDQTSLSALESLVQQNLFHDDALIVLEYPSDQSAPKVPGLFIERDRAYGDTHLCFLRQKRTDD